MTMKLYVKEKSYELYNGDMLDMKEVIVKYVDDEYVFSIEKEQK